MDKGVLGTILVAAGAIGAGIASLFGGRMIAEDNAKRAGTAQGEAYNKAIGGSIEPPKVPSGNIEPTGQVQ